MLIRPVLFKTSGCPSKSDYIRYVEDDMLLEGKIAELIFKLNPKLYQKYIWENKRNKPMLYVKLKKALYGTLQAPGYCWTLYWTRDSN